MGKFIVLLDLLSRKKRENKTHCATVFSGFCGQKNAIRVNSRLDLENARFICNVLNIKKI